MSRTTKDRLLEIVIRQILSDEGTTWQFRSFADLENASY
jgi:hypothetical protein